MAKAIYYIVKALYHVAGGRSQTYNAAWESIDSRPVILD